MATKSRSRFADLFERRANPLANHPPRALGGVGSRSTAESFFEFMANLFDFDANAFGSAHVMESVRFFKLGAKLAQTISIFGTGARIEGDSRATTFARNL